MCRKLVDFTPAEPLATIVSMRLSSQQQQWLAAGSPKAGPLQPPCLVLCWPWPEARSQAKPSQNVGLGWLWPWPDLLKSQSHWPGPRLKRPIRRSYKRPYVGSHNIIFDGLQCKLLCTTLHFTKTCMHKYLCLVCIIFH